MTKVEGYSFSLPRTGDLSIKQPIGTQMRKGTLFPFFPWSLALRACFSECRLVLWLRDIMIAKQHRTSVEGDYRILV